MIFRNQAGWGKYIKKEGNGGWVGQGLTGCIWHKQGLFPKLILLMLFASTGHLNPSYLRINGNQSPTFIKVNREMVLNQGTKNILILPYLGELKSKTSPPSGGVCSELQVHHLRGRLRLGTSWIEYLELSIMFHVKYYSH